MTDSRPLVSADVLSAGIVGKNSGRPPADGVGASPHDGQPSAGLGWRPVRWSVRWSVRWYCPLVIFHPLAASDRCSLQKTNPQIEVYRPGPRTSRTLPRDRQWISTAHPRARMCPDGQGLPLWRALSQIKAISLSGTAISCWACACRKPDIRLYCYHSWQRRDCGMHMERRAAS